jgi:superfamily II DNA or RNA helicase
MSLITDLENIPSELRDALSTDLELKIVNKFGAGDPRYIYPYTMEENCIRVPMAYGVSTLKINRRPRDDFPSRKLSFLGSLRPEQVVVRGDALKSLSKTGSVIISCYTGFGKTALAIQLATSMRFKTLVVVNKIVLINQWRDSILKFCPDARVQCLTTKSVMDQGVDFYIINAQNIEKMSKGYFREMGICLVDEIHMIMAEGLSKCMQHISPRYLVGLSATPYRPDGLDKLLELYFGEYKIIRKLWRAHKVYRVNTGFIPPVERTLQGRLNWGAILDSQAQNVDRNDLIIRIIQKFSDRNFLVLVKRVSQGIYLSEKLASLGESVTDLMGSNQKFSAEARILIGTCQKVGVGFDHGKMDALLLATDIEEYFIQYLGRVFRRQDVEPYIFDLVDNNGVLLKHFNTRKGVYKEHGGVIYNYSI